MKIKKGRGVSAFIMGSALVLSSVFPYGAMEVKAADEPYDLSDGLQGWYTFDDGTLNLDARSVDNLADTGDDFDGVLGSLSSENSTSITEGTGISGSSLHYTGNQAESYFRILNAVNTASDYTVSLWINIASDAPTNNTSINIAQQTGSGRTLLMAKNKKLGTYTGGSDILTQDTVDYGKWMNVVVSGSQETESDNQNRFDLYINGEQVVSQSVNRSSLINEVTDLQFGCHKNKNTGYSFTGDIDSIRIYNKSADADMAEALFEEHGAGIVYLELADLISQAQDLSENGLLGSEAQEAAALNAAVEAASSLTEEDTYAELTAARGALLAAIEAYQTAQGKMPVAIQISPDEVEREIPEYMFGVNHRYHMDGYGSWDAENKRLDPEFKALSDSAQFGSIRYPGGIVSNLFDWKRSIGEERETTIHGNWDEPAITPNFGVDEAARYIIDDLGAEMIYVYNFGNGSAQDAADLVEYLNCEVGENPNGGIDWAAVRAENGHPEPYNVKNFEIGNEVDEGRGYWMQDSPNTWSGSGDSYAKMYAEGAVRTFTKEKTAEFDNWNTTNNKTKASHYSDGTANQVKYMRYANDVTQHEDKSKMVYNVHVYVDDTEWEIVDSLADAGAENAVEVNYENGEIRFGDGTNGNIPSNGADIRVTYTVEKDGIADYWDAMKAVDPDIKIYSGFSSANIARVIHDSEEAGADGGKFDGIAVHPYSRTNGQISDTDSQFYEKVLSAIDTSVMTQINNRKNALDQYWPDGSKNVCISEYGIFNHSGDVVQSQTHAIYIAENLMRFVDLGVAYTNKHCLIDFPAGDVLGPGKQALILAIADENGGYNYYGTPSLEVMKIFNMMSGSSVIRSNIVNNSLFYNQVPSIDSLTTKDEEGNLYVIVVNMERDEAKDIQISADGIDLTGKNIEGMKLESEDVYSVNSLEEPDNVKAESFTLISDGASLTYTMQPHSVAAFKIAADTVEEPEIPKLLEIGDAPVVEAFENGTDLETIVQYLNENYGTISITTGDPTVTSAKVVWTGEIMEGAYDAASKEAQTFTLKGTVTCPEGIDAGDVPLDIQVRINVKADEKTEGGLPAGDKNEGNTPADNKKPEASNTPVTGVVEPIVLLFAAALISGGIIVLYVRREKNS